MTRPGKQARKGSKKLPPRDARIERRERIARRKGKAERGEPWFAGKRPILRFAVLFAGLIVPLHVLFYTVVINSRLFNRFLNLTAEVSGAVLRILGTEAMVSGSSISTSRFALRLDYGCDALQPAGLFFCAVLVSPVLFRSKLPGLLLGTSLLLALNIVRVVSLYYAGVYVPDWFELLHVDVWQALFIFLAIVFWVVWARWAVRKADLANAA